MYTHYRGSAKHFRDDGLWILVTRKRVSRKPGKEKDGKERESYLKKLGLKRKSRKEAHEHIGRRRKGPCVRPATIVIAGNISVLGSRCNSNL